jgi:hypothetical protein
MGKLRVHVILMPPQTMSLSVVLHLLGFATRVQTSKAKGGEVDGTGCRDVEMLSGDDSSESSDSEPELESEEEM